MTTRHWHSLAGPAFVLFALLSFVAWAVIQPYDSAPDEYMRFQIADYIYRHGALPVGGDPELRNPTWGTDYAFQPILSYIFGAGFMTVVSPFTTQHFALVLAARMATVLFSTGTVAMCVLIARKLFRGTYRWIFVISVAMLPQFIFISSYVNNDALAILSSAVIVYAWIIGLESHWSTRSCLLLGVGLSLCALSYYNAYGFILCSVVLYVTDRLMTLRSAGGDGASVTGTPQRFLRDTAVQVLLVVAVVAALAGWWFIRNAVLYDGDVLGLWTSDEFAMKYAVDNAKPGASSGDAWNWTLWEMLNQHNWLLYSTMSFIGVFGYMRVPLPPGVYVAYGAFWAVCAIGVVWRLLRTVRRHDPDTPPRQWLLSLVMLLAMPIPIVLSMYHSYFVDYQAQGRYFMPMLIPMMYFVTLGLQQVLDALMPSTRWNRGIQVLVCAGLVLGALYSLLGVLVPLYLS